VITGSKDENNAYGMVKNKFFWQLSDLNLQMKSDINNDWTHKAKDKKGRALKDKNTDKDCAYKNMYSDLNYNLYGVTSCNVVRDRQLGARSDNFYCS